MTNDVRFATFNVYLNRSAEEELIADLYNPDNSQAQATVTELEFLGEVTFDTGFVFADTGRSSRSPHRIAVHGKSF